ncbi:MAG: CotH kinase family protein [Clostridia bacterium]|nr:CotH kinase family protein [Clostridia bacterium]
MKTFKRRAGRGLLILLCAATLLIALAVAASADEALVYSTKDEAPFTVLAEGGALPEDLSVWKATGKKYYLFLPAALDRTGVTIRYDGKLMAYDETAGKLIAPGESFVCDLSADTANLYEYNEAEGVYVKYAVNVMQAGHIPTLWITLTDGDEALIRINSSQSDVEQGSIFMVDEGGKVVYDGEMTRMKGHGLTSYERSGRLNTKNSYNINLGQKAELVPGAGRSKKWSLLRIRTWGNYDPTGMSYVTAFNTFNALVKDEYFNQCTRFVDVYIDGAYWGVFVLTERMDINGSMTVTDLEEKTTMPSTKTTQISNKKSDPAIAAGIKSYSYATASTVPEGTDITGGYILEIMCNHYGECGFRTKHNMYVNIKSPAYPTKEMVQYIAQYVQEFENALFSDTGYNELGKHYTDYVDERSYAAQTLIYAYYLNWEIYRTSTYMTKDAGEVIKFGPVWDFESGPWVMYDQTLFGTTFAYNDVEQQHCWFEQAWRKGDYLHLISEMNGQLKEIVDQVMGLAEPEIVQTFEDCANDVRQSQEMNWLRWGQPDTFDTWLDAYFESLGVRYDTWFNNLWNPSKYLLGLTVDGVDNGDGTWTLTGTSYGKIDSDYLLWFEITDDWTAGEQIGTGESITVPAGGRYYARVTGPNNAYYQYANGKIFKNKSLTVTSNVVTEVPVTLTNPRIEGGKLWQRMLAAKNAEPEVIAEIPAPEHSGPAAEKGEETAETAPRLSRSASMSDAEWIVMTAGIVLVAGVMAALGGTKRKGGKTA